MAAIRLLVPALPTDTPLGAHRKATMANDWLQITFPYLSADTPLDDLARDWVEQARPGNKKPLTRPGSPKLAKVTLTALFADPDDTQASLEAPSGPLTTLRGMAGSDQPVMVTFGDMLGDQRLTKSGYWVIRDCSIHVTARNHERNQATRAEASIDLLEANVPGWAPSVQADRYNSEIVGAGRGVPRSYVVGEGDRLWGIARLLYGDASRWIRLGAANGITDPRRQLTPGLVLKVP